MGLPLSLGGGFANVTLMRESDVTDISFTGLSIGFEGTPARTK
jgi:hypothetical protein